MSSPPRPTQVARVELGAALADEDLAGLDDLAAEALHAEPLGVGVAAVAGAGRALLVCHVVRLLPARDAGDLDLGQRLTVTLPLVVAGLVLELVDADLRALGRARRPRRSPRPGQLAASVVTVVAVDEQDAGSGDLVAGLAVELLDLDTSPSATLYCLPPVLTIAYTDASRLLCPALRTARAGRRVLDGCERRHRRRPTAPTQ